MKIKMKIMFNQPIVSQVLAVEVEVEVEDNLGNQSGVDGLDVDIIILTAQEDIDAGYDLIILIPIQ